VNDSKFESQKVRLALVTVVLVACAAIAIVLTRDTETDKVVSSEEAVERITGIEFGTVAVTGDALPDFERQYIADSTLDPAVGLVAPTVAGQQFNQEPISLAPNDKFRLVLFLAHWCPHCNVELPTIVDSIENKEFDERVQVVSVATAVNETLPNFPPSKWFNEYKYNGDVLLDDRNGTAMNSFGGTGFPYFVLLSGDNRVLWRSAGELPPGTLVTEVNSRVAAAVAP